METLISSELKEKKKKLKAFRSFLRREVTIWKIWKGRVRSRPWTEPRVSRIVMRWKVKVRLRPWTELRGSRPITWQQNLKLCHNLDLSRTRGLCIQSWLRPWLYTKMRGSCAIFPKKEMWDCNLDLLRTRGLRIFTGDRDFVSRESSLQT